MVPNKMVLTFKKGMVAIEILRICSYYIKKKLFLTLF